MSAPEDRVLPPTRIGGSLCYMRGTRALFGRTPGQIALERKVSERHRLHSRAFLGPALGVSPSSGHCVWEPSVESAPVWLYPSQKKETENCAGLCHEWHQLWLNRLTKNDFYVTEMVWFWLQEIKSCHQDLISLHHWLCLLFESTPGRSRCTSSHLLFQ